MFEEILKYRDLLYMLILRDIRIRYKQAAMGFLWAIFMPILAVFSGVLIQKAMSIVSGKPMDTSGIMSIAVKVLPWTFFVSSIRFSVQSLVGNMSLVTKIYFPREVLPFSSIAACLFDLLIAIVTLVVLFIVLHVPVSVYLLYTPLLLFLLVLFTSGLGLLLASANLFFRDIKYIVEIILMFGIFFTPVFYQSSTFGKWKPVLMINPVGTILELMNESIVFQQMPQPGWLLYAAISSVLIFFIGMQVFHKAEPLFAEYI